MLSHQKLPRHTQCFFFLLSASQKSSTSRMNTTLQKEYPLMAVRAAFLTFSCTFFISGIKALLSKEHLLKVNLLVSFPERFIGFFCTVGPQTLRAIKSLSQAAKALFASRCQNKAESQPVIGLLSGLMTLVFTKYLAH